MQTADLPDPLTPVNVADCVREAVEHTQVVAGERRITVLSNAPADQAMVHGDAELLATAVRNLVTNAINYSGDGSHIAVVTARCGDLVEVSVTDHGQGISAEEQERVFERFYRVDAARSRTTGGTGLGLSIVKHVCANLGGDVVVRSRMGRGSTFTIRLPAIEDPAPVASGRTSVRPARTARALGSAPSEE